MGRLIDTDDVVKIVDKHTNDDMTLNDDITCILENVKTAYDLDKVVEQLEESEVIGSDCVGNGFKCIPTYKAIEIVKGGK